MPFCSFILFLAPGGQNMQLRKKVNKQIKFWLNVAEHFYFMHFFPKLHVLVTRREKAIFFSFFGHKGKNKKGKKSPPQLKETHKGLLIVERIKEQ